MCVRGSFGIMAMGRPWQLRCRRWVLWRPPTPRPTVGAFAAKPRFLCSRHPRASAGRRVRLPDTDLPRVAMQWKSDGLHGELARARASEQVTCM